MNNESNIVSKVWSLAHVLQNDGVSYGDYLEQLTYLLFLKRGDDFAQLTTVQYLAFLEDHDILLKSVLSVLIPSQNQIVIRNSIT